MKNIQLITRQITLWALLTAGLFLNTAGQVYQPGDLYTFEDGSKGIVFYVNPDNPGSGTVAALHDLGEQYALWNGNKPSVMKNSTLHRYDFDYSGNISWSHEGKLFTQLLKASGASPLTDTIGAEIDNGWYIPDVVQLRCLLAMAPYLEEYFAAQQGEVFNMWNRNYWSSCFSPYEENKVYYVDKIRFNITDGSNSKYIRLVRDFPDSSVVHAFWKEFPPLSETKVSPDSTRDYDALVILRSDTIRLSGSVTVHHPVQDTIIYATSSSQLSDGEFIAACHTFTGITAPGSYTARDTLTAANGCDSIVVVTLIVTEDAHYYDTICPQVEQYVFAPFDTVFLSGTASGEYVHHGSKVIDGHIVDTTAYLHLTVLPVYDIPDTVSWCLYGNSETMPYEHDPRVTLHAESTGGTVAISATSSNTAITIEEGTAVGDFLLHMTTVHGCDSIVRLHVRTTAVARDTLYYDVSASHVTEGQITTACHTFTGITAPGSYTTRDTLTAANGCDSIVVVTLIVTEDAHYYDTICPQVEQYVFAPFDTVFLSGTASGEYVHHGSKVIDGHTIDTTAYLHLTVLPVYDIPDTVSWCLYGESETMSYPNDPRITLSAETNDGTVTISATSSTSAIIIEEGTSTGDFLLRMTTVHGCDSIVRLHIRTTAVARDTLYYDVSASHVTEGKITTACHTFTGITTPGSYTARDTLTAANGCDSIVVVELIVTEDAHYYDTICPQVEQYVFAPFDTVFLSGTASGEYVHHGSKVIDGHTVDTIAYLHLTVLPVYDNPDTVSWCLYGESETMPYPNDPRITLSAETNDGTVTISATSSNTAITIEEGTAVGDFLLHMTTVHGCDSIVRLHIRTTAVTRDTLYSHVSVQQVQDNRVTVDNHTFENVTGLGSYTARDTLTAANGCDSIVVVTLIVTEDAHYYDTICPQVEQYVFAPFDTVFLSGTVSGEYVHHGSKVIDGHTVDTTAYLHLTVLPVYDIPDTVSWCLYGESETMSYPNDPRVTLTAETNNGTVTVTATSSTSAITIEEGTSTGDFLLRMTTVHGCDSIVRLHVRTTAVTRDTIYYDVSASHVTEGQITTACHTFTGITAPGSYTARDTLTAANGCDSIVVVTLIVTEDAHYYDTICPQVEQYVFAPFDTVLLSGTVSGEYVHHGSKVIDGHTIDTTAFLHLTVLPVYDIPDTVSWCLYGESETMPYPNDPRVTLTAETNNGTVTISATSSNTAITIEEGTAVGDFLLHMTTVHGCDSIVRLHVRTTAVTRDTMYSHVSVQQVQDNRVTVDNHTFENVTGLGSYTARDTLTAANGCDSIVVVTLIVTEDAHYYDTICPQVEQYAFAPFDTVFLSGTVSGEYVHHGSKVIDGHTVDTSAYLHLTVLPVYDIPDTVSWCLYGESETMPYPNDPRITLSAETNDGTVTATSSTSAITIEGGTSTGDFLLRMTTVHGCDSIVRLHVRTTAVTRDTMYSHISVQQVQDNRVTVDNYTFENVNGLGSYTARDTLTAANGCDSIVVVELIVNGCSVDFTISCPPDIYDTLAFGDCAMTIYPEEIGTPTIQCDQERPFFIRNDMPESSVFPQGDNIITWIATDSICGFSDTCEQHVFIAYPQCPDAIDCEGNIYAGIRIGCDCWTQRNLESTKYSDCTDIPDVMGYASLLHPDTANNIAIFGRLYTFEAAVHDSADNGHGHIQGICPEGWYLPTPEKYESLNEYGTEALRSPLYWIIGAGNNSTGFSALPAGYYNGEKSRYEGLLSETYFWSSQGVGTYTMRMPSFIAYYCDQVLLQDLSGGLGYSVRCIKERE